MADFLVVFHVPLSSSGLLSVCAVFVVKYICFCTSRCLCALGTDIRRTVARRSRCVRRLRHALKRTRLVYGFVIQGILQQSSRLKCQVSCTCKRSSTTTAMEYLSNRARRGSKPAEIPEMGGRQFAFIFFFKYLCSRRNYWGGDWIVAPPAAKLRTKSMGTTTWIICIWF